MWTHPRSVDHADLEPAARDGVEEEGADRAEPAKALVVEEHLAEDDGTQCAVAVRLDDCEGERVGEGEKEGEGEGRERGRGGRGTVGRVSAAPRNRQSDLGRTDRDADVLDDGKDAETRARERPRDAAGRRGREGQCSLDGTQLHCPVCSAALSPPVTRCEAQQHSARLREGGREGGTVRDALEEWRQALRRLALVVEPYLRYELNAP